MDEPIARGFATSGSIILSNFSRTCACKRFVSLKWLVLTVVFLERSNKGGFRYGV